MHKNIKIIFFGTPRFAEIILKKLIDKRYKPSLVITAPDKPAGRKQELTPSAVKILAQKHNIKVWQPEKLEIANWKLEISKLGDVDLAIVAAYGKIIPAKILDTLSNKFINVHPSLLPSWRGSSPIQSAILHKDTASGNTIILMDKKIDHGPILAQSTIPIPHNITTEILTEKLAESGADLLVSILQKFISGKIKEKKQNHNLATYTELISKSHGEIDWSKTSEDIEQMLHAYTPWPGIFSFLIINEKKLRLKILSLKIEGEESNDSGKIIKYKKGFAIQTKKGLVIPEKIQLEGKRIQTAKEFIRGYPGIIDTKFI